VTIANRLLGPADLPLLRELLTLFGKAFGEPEEFESAPASDDYLRALLAREDFVVLVAQEDGDVVGGLAAYILPKYEKERKEAYLYDLAVDAGHRRRGIATGLIEALKPVARERGCYVIFVQADQGDTPAIRLYESLGTREEAVHFDIPVAGSA
jgi:ribosomal protein S18 acetylase RimI-like enzyme